MKKRISLFNLKTALLFAFLGGALTILIMKSNSNNSTDLITNNMSRFPTVTSHGDIQEVFKDVFFVTGSVVMAPGLQISRNMIILREGGSLTLISAVRLNAEGLSKLDALGKVEHVMKLGDYHLGDKYNGIDDAFYLDRYKAKYWAMPGMTHLNGLETTNLMIPGGELPIEGASLFSFETAKRPEGLLILEQDSGVLISADSFQNWTDTQYFSVLAKTALKLSGFIRPANIGPKWRNDCEPQTEDFKRLKGVKFQNLIPSHGTPIKNTAKEDLAPIIKELYGV